jgi:flagellar biosynthesis protein FlhA
MEKPAFGVAAMWIVPRLQNQALATGCAVVDQTSVLATHLAEVVKQHAHELLTRQQTKRLLDQLADLALTNKNPVLLVEAARQTLGRALVQPLLSESGGLRVATLDRALEAELGRAFGGGASVGAAGLSPPFARRILDGLRRPAGDQVAVAAPGAAVFHRRAIT